MPDILPDSRMQDRRQFIPSVLGNLVPVFCGNCGKRGPDCYEENMTFMFWLCRPCAETYGPIAGTMLMPDEVYWEKLKQEQLATYGRFLTEAELVAIVAADASPLATLIKEGRAS